MRDERLTVLNSDDALDEMLRLLVVDHKLNGCNTIEVASESLGFLRDVLLDGRGGVTMSSGNGNLHAYAPCS
jgi:hypothetical protein